MITRPRPPHGATDLTRGKAYQCAGLTVRMKRCRNYRWIGWPRYFDVEEWFCKTHKYGRRA